MHSTVLFTFFIFFFPGALLAADLSFSLNVETIDDRGILTLENKSRIPVSDVRIDVELSGRKVRVAEGLLFAPRSSQEFNFRIDFPKSQGSFPLITTVSYLNDGKRLSFRDLGTFHFQREKVVAPVCNLRNVSFYKEHVLTITCSEPRKINLIVPEEISVLPQGHTQEGSFTKKEVFVLREIVSPRELQASIFLTEVTQDEKGVSSLSIQKRELNISSDYENTPPIPNVLLVLSFLSGLMVSLVLWRSAETSGEVKSVAIVRWAWTVAVVSLLLLIFQNGFYVSDAILSSVGRGDLPRSKVFDWVWHVFVTVVEFLSFKGSNYSNFRSYVALPLYVYICTFNFLVIRYLLKPEPSKDKNWQLLKFLFPQGRRGQSRSDKKLARIGFLAILVKAFFFPIVASWTIGNTLHFLWLLDNFEWNVFWFHRVLLHTIIAIDVFIFCVGYATELPQLKNQIRSVEPTVFGWIVCLACYPPFNSFAFLPFDHQVIDNPYVASEMVQNLALIPILLLWVIYTWASVALGFKASNLTNRGIVSSGPYRFVRHPAYAAKVAIWWIEGLLLQKYFVTLCMTFMVVYALRAYTEERHLSEDPDYIEYCSTVRYRFIPGLL